MTNLDNNTEVLSIVFFDGYCGLCNRFIDFLIKKDKRNRLLFSPLQGNTYAQLKDQTLEFSTVIFHHDGKDYQKSTAALKILIQLGGYRKLYAVFFIVPGFIRDAVYDHIAKNRFKWFGKRETCRIPSIEEQKKFLP